jgi:hypothetical protein
MLGMAYRDHWSTQGTSQLLPTRVHHQAWPTPVGSGCRLLGRVLRL